MSTPRDSTTLSGDAVDEVDDRTPRAGAPRSASTPGEGRPTGRRDPAGDLDGRKASILRSVVAEYIDTAQPVGSSHVARISGLNVSAATVRHEMAVLEDEGYLGQPHTSAGRIPTDKGYRYFVDHLPSGGGLAVPDLEQVRSFFARTHGELEAMLHDTSELLSHLTQHAAVVVGPAHETSSIRSAHMVWMGPRSVLVVVVLSDGAVEKYAIEPGFDVEESHVYEASGRLGARLVGRKAMEITTTLPESDSVVDKLVAGACASVSRPLDGEGASIFVGGASRMAQAFDAIDTVRSVLSILEQQFMVVSLLRNVLDRDDLAVSIGAEHGMPSLAECSVIVAPYRVGDNEIGAIGVLGPTRMHYEQAMAAVAVVGEQLGARLGE